MTSKRPNPSPRLNASANSSAGASANPRANSSTGVSASANSSASATPRANSSAGVSLSANSSPRVNSSAGARPRANSSASAIPRANSSAGAGVSVGVSASASVSAPPVIDLRSFAGTPPRVRPQRPYFSCGPTAKRPGWRPDFLAHAPLGRNHRTPDGLALIQEALTMMRELLTLPDDYRIAIVPGSNTGAFEMAMWGLLGRRGVDVLGWEAFGHRWVRDVLDELQLGDSRAFIADYGDLPNLDAVNDHQDRDVVFTWNGTTSGVRVPNGDWIHPDRTGLMLADATSAMFAFPVPISKLDVITFSWQKALGGEAAHGILILSPKAIARLETHTPKWATPKLFRLAEEGVVNDSLFDGLALNTPSLMCVADAVDALRWASDIGGVAELFARTQRNAKVVDEWVQGREDVGYLARDPATISPTALCLMPRSAWYNEADDATRQALMQAVVRLLAGEGVAYDINSYRLAPPGLRLWGGPTVEVEDMQALMAWLDWGLAAAEAFADKHSHGDVGDVNADVNAPNNRKHDRKQVSVV